MHSVATSTVVARILVFPKMKDNVYRQVLNQVHILTTHFLMIYFNTGIILLSGLFPSNFHILTTLHIDISLHPTSEICTA
jgi:hypothetical protein